MDKKKISRILNSFDIKDVERQVIYCYTNKHSLDYTCSVLLSDYLFGFENNIILSAEIELLDIDSIKDLENCLEMLIPENDRKVNGAFFTPNYIVDYIINQINPQESDKNIDPSSGCGAFLVGLAEYYHAQYNKPIKQTIKENLFGSDILEYNIERAKLLLSLLALQYGEIVEEFDFNLYVRDSLRYKWTETFDNVIGNPPYVKFQDLSDDNREYLLKHWKTVEGGSFNLYFAFFELGYSLLNKNGKLGYITPNNYFTSLAGESLRQFFNEHQCITRIVDFSYKKVFDVQTYTAITFLSKQKNESVLYDRISNSQQPNEFLSKVNGSPNPFICLNSKKWRLLKKGERENIETIEKTGTPINQMFDICAGVATLKDSVFFIDGAKQQGEYFIRANNDGKLYKIEKDATRSVYKISDFKNQGDIVNNARRIIFPYTVNGAAKIISEETFQEQYPYCYEYLVSAKKELLARDKGKVKFDPFYAWGRTQGLTRFGKRIINPTFSQLPRFLLVDEEESFFTNGYGIFFKEQSKSLDLFGQSSHLLANIENIDLVQKVLNSDIMHYYISRTSVSIEGGYPCYQKNFIEKFTIPSFSINEVMELRSLTKKLEINQFLMAKYQLNFPTPNLSL